MEIEITGEEVIKTRGTSIGIAPSTVDYTFSYSFDGIHWTDWPEVVPANESLIVNGMIAGASIKLKGNTDEIKAII